MLNLDRDYIKDCLVEDGKTLLFTLTNAGYIDYTINMLKSLERLDIDKYMFVFCLDKISQEYFTANGYKTHLIDSNMPTFASFKDDNFTKICFIKLYIITQILKLNLNAFYTDGDIFFVKNPLDYIMQIKDINGDMWIQNDTIFDNNFRNVCAGFMYVRSNYKTIKYFDLDIPDFSKRYKECIGENNDQTYLNKYIIENLTVHLFPLNKFPNGNYFYNFSHNIAETIIMVHFNWLIGHEKKEKMKKYNMWLGV